MNWTQLAIDGHQVCPIAVHQPIVETTAIGGVDYCLRKLGALNVRCDTSDRDAF
jgi:hypothetical protein